MRLKEKIALLLLLYVTFSCQKETKRLDNIFLEFATVDKASSLLRFRLDNQRLLIPRSNDGYDGQSGQRVILNYTPLSGDTIKINQVVDIFTGVLEEHEQPIIDSSPIWLQSVWVSGGYLNIIFDVEYYQGGHKVGLTRNKENASGDIYFYYSRENDPPGYRQKMYLSFSLHPLTEDEEFIEILKLHINTSEGGRVFKLNNR